MRRRALRFQEAHRRRAESQKSYQNLLVVNVSHSSPPILSPVFIIRSCTRLFRTCISSLPALCIGLFGSSALKFKRRVCWGLYIQSIALVAQLNYPTISKTTMSAKVAWMSPLRTVKPFSQFIYCTVPLSHGWNCIEDRLNTILNRYD